MKQLEKELRGDREVVMEAVKRTGLVGWSNKHFSNLHLRFITSLETKL